MLRETDPDWLDEGVWTEAGGEKMSVIQLQADVSVLGSFFYFHRTTQTGSKWKTMSTLSAIYQNILTWY